MSRTTETNAAEVWKSLVAELESRDPVVRPLILESWRRSREAGVPPAPEHILLHRIGPDELAHRLKKNREFIDIAAPVLRAFSATNACTRHVVYLTDSQGIVLASFGNDPEMLAYGLVPGFDWSEKRMGTNGAGTALATHRPVAVIGPEHYQLTFRETTCMASPVCDPSGRVIGAVDFSTHVGSATLQQFDGVVRITRIIERRLLCRASQSQEGAA